MRVAKMRRIVDLGRPVRAWRSCRLLAPWIDRLSRIVNPRSSDRISIARGIRYRAAERHALQISVAGLASAREAFRKQGSGRTAVDRRQLLLGLTLAAAFAGSPEFAGAQSNNTIRIIFPY